jgi:hypothetical protein
MDLNSKSLTQNAATVLDNFINSDDMAGIEKKLGRRSNTRVQTVKDDVVPTETLKNSYNKQSLDLVASASERKGRRQKSSNTVKK